MEDYPKIGIRPIIDGRLGGIRESLEGVAMDMANRVSRLFEKELKYPNGEVVQCVIADSCIGGVKEAADCAEKFKKENVGVSLSVTPSWCYGAETMDMDPQIPKAIWGFNASESPGAVYLAATLAAHNQKGLPSFGIYGKDVQDMEDKHIPDDIKEKLLRFAKAGLAVAIMKGQSYLAIGSVCMGIGGSMVNPDFFQDYLGMRNEYVDATEVLRRIKLGIYDHEELERARKWKNKYCTTGGDYNQEKNIKSEEEKEEDWDFILKMTLIARDLMQGNDKLNEMGYEEEALGHHALIGGFQGQRQWTDFLPNGDFTEAILNSSFDWNGKKAPTIFATENDSLNAASMLFNHLLTNTAQIFADVRTYWSPAAIKRVTGWDADGKAKNGVIHLKNSGSIALDACGKQQKDGRPAMKPHWDIEEQEVEACLAATTWFPANRDYFRGGGFSSQLLTEGGMPVTMCRVNLVKGLGPVLQIAEGWTIDLPKEVHQQLDEQTDKTWPTTWFVPKLLENNETFNNVYNVMANWGANHGAISYGHIGADLITLAAMLRIPVNMHNVEDKDIFRPSTWGNFGMDKEGADYRACSVLGPLY